MNKPVYLLAAAQISAQPPLCDDWLDKPISYADEYVSSVEPDYKQYFSPLETRRYGKLLKRALFVSRKAMEMSGITDLDAIITGTGLGCIENTEFFLKDLTFTGEKLLKPTHFMNSTHNTISSIIAIDTKCKGYNSTYVHKGISFECALQDAFLQMQLGKIQTALVGGHDEMTPDYFQMLKKIGYLGQKNQVFAGETAVAMILGTEKTENAICKIENVEICYNACNCGLDAKPDAVMLGTNGDFENDSIYFTNCEKLLPNIPLLHYKHIFGESYTAPALGVFAAANILQRQKTQNFQMFGQYENLKSILFYNHFEGKNHSFILLSKL